MNIVQADSTHLHQVARLFDLYRQFYHKPADLKAAIDFIRTRLEKSDSKIFLALDTKSNAMGFTQLYPSFSSVGMQPIWILNDLFVHPDSRNQGVAQYLINEVKQFARTSGAATIKLATAVDNVNAQKLYLKLGYKKVEDFYQFSLTI